MRKILALTLFITFISLNIKAQNYPNIVNYHINKTQTYGTKIKTNIPFQNGVGMPTVKIEGYNYSDGSAQPANLRSKPLSLIIAWEAWDGRFSFPVVSSNGASIPDVWLSVENGKIVIFLDQIRHYQRFTVSAFAIGVGEKPEFFKDWTVVDEPKGGTNAALCTYKNNFAGNIGIGTEDPKSMLDVRGKIIADEVEIKINKGADFVFEPDYNLRSLSEVETFVKENQHLPDIPSEKAMVENGLNVNDMQMKLLQKIEELTLYVIEQDKKYNELKAENELINQKLKELDKGL